MLQTSHGCDQPNSRMTSGALAIIMFVMQNLWVIKRLETQIDDLELQNYLQCLVDTTLLWCSQSKVADPKSIRRTLKILMKHCNISTFLTSVLLTFRTSLRFLALYEISQSEEVNKMFSGFKSVWVNLVNSHVRRNISKVLESVSTSVRNKL